MTWNNPAYLCQINQKIRHGRKWAIASLVCAVLALIIAPVVFGPLGIIAGMVAYWWALQLVA